MYGTSDMQDETFLPWFNVLATQLLGFCMETMTHKIIQGNTPESMRSPIHSRPTAHDPQQEMNWDVA